MPVIKAVDNNDGDTLSGLSLDEEVIFIGSGSWSNAANITLGDLRKVVKLTKEISHQKENTCENCVSLGGKLIVDNQSDDIQEDDEIDTGFYRCKKTNRHDEDGQEAQGDYYTFGKGLVSGAVVTGSGSGYAQLLVEADFFCALYEKKTRTSHES